jgi:cobalt-zinc-cadmium efflux system outer membrane protein
LHARDIERLIEILRVREREGEGSRFDRIRAEQELREARHSMTAAAVAEAGARTTLSAMLPPGTSLGRISRGRLLQPVPPLEPLIARAAGTRAELRALQHAGDGADREADAARRQRIPIPTIVGGMKRADQGGAARAQGAMVGVRASVPLFDAGGREAARWGAERARIDAERLATADRISAEIRRAFDVLTLRQQAAADDQASADDELMRIAEIAYREGEVGILELLDAARTASTAAVRSIDIRLQARLAQIALERAVGGVLWP